MSTKRLRLRIPFSSISLAGLALVVLGGCSSTGRSFGLGNRMAAAAPPKMKTFLAVGDKPLPVVSGEPGASVAADAPEPSVRSSRVKAEGRISGRVLDSEGRPVANARVRLGVGDASSGRIARTTTDRSGGFTLKGLRPGSTHTLVAEWDGEQGAESGRVSARVDDTDVRIQLVAAGGADELPAKAGSRVSRVSERAPAASEGPGAIAPATESPVPGEPTSDDPGDSAINEEDLPPAPEAEALAPEPDRAVARVAAPEPRWRSGDAVDDETPPPGLGTAIEPEATPDPENPVEPAEPAPLDPAPRRESATIEPPTASDDGPNPLPPALEPESGSPARSDREARRDEPEETNPPPRLAAAPRASEPTATPDRAARDSVDDMAPGARVVVPETYSPINLNDDPIHAQARAPEGARAAGVVLVALSRPCRACQAGALP